MKIPDVINERITNGDWSHLNEGPLPLKDYMEMYEEVVKESTKIPVDLSKEFNSKSLRL